MGRGCARFGMLHCARGGTARGCSDGRCERPVHAGTDLDFDMGIDMDVDADMALDTGIGW